MTYTVLDSVLQDREQCHGLLGIRRRPLTATKAEKEAFVRRLALLDLEVSP